MRDTYSLIGELINHTDPLVQEAVDKIRALQAEVQELKMALDKKNAHIEEMQICTPFTEELRLSMRAGARAILNNKKYFGTTYCLDPFGKNGGPKEISYHRAAELLTEAANGKENDCDL